MPNAQEGADAEVPRRSFLGGAVAAVAGVALTPAGSAFPYKRDPEDTNIRLAPSFPVLGEVTRAMEAVTVCVQLAAAEKLLA